MSKKLALKSETIRNLTNDQMAAAVGGSLGGSGTSVISQSGGTSVLSGPSVIQPGTPVMTITSGGTSVISRGGH